MQLLQLLSLFANILASALLISINKVLLTTRGFDWSCTLSGLQFASTAAFSSLTSTCKVLSADSSVSIQIPPLVLLLFTVVCVISITGSQLSLKLNSVGFFQISKLGQVALTCLLERLLFKKRLSGASIFSILIVLSGIFVTCVGSVVVTSIAGVVVASIAVFAASLQQLSLAFLQTRYSLTSNELVAQTFYLQAIVLLLGGPFVDRLLVNSFPISWLKQNDLFGNTCYLLLSCTASIFVNYSQIICIKQLSATGFQVLGNAKTVCILFIGYLFFDGKVSAQTVAGQGIAVLGMLFYGAAAAKELKGGAGGTSGSLAAQPKAHPKPEQNSLRLA